MKALRLNPLNHDIELILTNAPEPGLGSVGFVFGCTRGDVILTDSECVKIGSWFQSLAVHLKNEKRKAEKVSSRKTRSSV